MDRENLCGCVTNHRLNVDPIKCVKGLLFLLLGRTTKLLLDSVSTTVDGRTLLNVGLKWKQPKEPPLHNTTCFMALINNKNRSIINHQQVPCTRAFPVNKYLTIIP